MSADSSHRLFLVYPEGNRVEIGPDTPYQIIGNSGFGKPILERALTKVDPLLYAFKLGVLSFDATRLCAADVDFPLDVLLYTRGSFKLMTHRYERENLKHISNWGQERMRAAIDELPSKWVESAFSKLKAGTGPPLATTALEQTAAIAPPLLSLPQCLRCRDRKAALPHTAARGTARSEVS